MNEDIRKYFDRAEKYEKSRPEYPKIILDYLLSFDFSKNTIIADIGSGTGKLSKIFLENGNKVYTVEPNENMRKMTDSLFGKYSNYHSMNGTAENTGLPDKSIDIITVAQAFHWFDTIKALMEFRKILKDNGLLILLWNKSNAKTIFQKEINNIFSNIINKNETIHNKLSENDIINTFKIFYKKVVIENYADNDFNDVIDGIFSYPYAPEKGTSEYKEIYNKI
ncbi:MAG: class I SAM-dependent methyltransferase [Treponema sp.]|nr:class I SAM-dependent methyltransferase [Treponema sp.]